MDEVGLDDTRQRILASARRLFAERGIAETSLADVAEQVGVTKSAVAYHFHPKEALVEAVLQEAATDVLALLSGPEPRTKAQRVSFLLSYVELLVKHRELIPIMITTSSVPRASDARIEPLRDEVLRRLTPARPRASDTARVWATLGAVHIGLYRTLDLPSHTVLDSITTAALAAYRS